ncbi:MAG: DNA-directed RNA polymerase subunit omega [Sulfurimonas sp.]
MRTEILTAKALERVNHDKYLLANAVGKRAEEISNGATPLVDADVKMIKATDIALLEIAEGKLDVHLEE